MIRWLEVIPHDITAITLYGQADIIQYEVRNHEGKRHSQNIFDGNVAFSLIINFNQYGKILLHLF